MIPPSQQNDQPTAESPYSIRFYKHYGHSPAWQLVPQAVNFFEESGFAPRPYLPPPFTDSCVTAIDEDGNAIGFIIYYCGCESWDVTLSFVDSEHRREHIHTALFFALRDKAREQGNIDSITCTTHANNLAAQAAFEAQGRTKEYITYTYSLKDGSDGKSPLRAQ